MSIDWRTIATAEGLKIAPGKSVDVDVLAVACLGPVAPADAHQTTTYRVQGDGSATRVAKPHDAGSAVEGMRRAAGDPD